MESVSEKPAQEVLPSWEALQDEKLEFVSELDIAHLLAIFGTDRLAGLSKDEAQARLKICGANRQSKLHKVNPVRIFFHQFQSSVVALLLVAALASFLYHEHLQAAGILAAVLINALTGFYMEYRAGMSLAGLEALAGQTIRSLRQSEQCELSVTDLVPGDLVILEAGARVPADLRLIECAGLSVDEAPLTGESAPVFKELTNKTEGELSNILYHGTLVAAGRGVAVVVKTGSRSSLGKLGKLLESTDTGATPLEIQLEDLGKQLSILTIVICTIVSAVGIWHREDLLLMVETGVALAVAAIPEGLPVLATLALAVGTQRMVRNRAILRHLSAVETLGCTGIICTDKTGTLTENQMTVCRLYLPDRFIEVTGNNYAPEGDLIEQGQIIKADGDRALSELICAGALCNDARLENHAEEEGWHVHGDPTEGALLTLAEKSGLSVKDLNARFPRISELPFDLTRKRMSTLHQNAGGNLVAYIKGSPGATIEICSKVLRGDAEFELDESERKKWIAVNESYAQQGLRVLALARKEINQEPFCLDQETLEKDLTLIGLAAIKDPPREGVADAIKACKKAGIRVIMLTGDQALTAQAIASELGIIDKEESGSGFALTGKQLENMNEEEARIALRNACVLSRVTPELKLNIVRTLQKDRAVVSMTGDGVNDAPALKQANIGVAMGRKGTDLARSASQMVITDDNFRTIVKAIEQGRMIYGNIQRAVGYLLTASLSSVITVALGILCNVGLPLSPLQLLWLNLIMHIFPGLGIVLQRADKSVMEQEPRNPDRKLISAQQQVQIWMRSIVVSVFVILAVAHAETFTRDSAHSTTIGLCTLSLCLLLQAWSWLGVQDLSVARRLQRTEIGSSMVLNMVFAYLLLFAALYMPGLMQILGTVRLSANELGFSFAVSIVSCICTFLLQLALPFLYKVKARS